MLTTLGNIFAVLFGAFFDRAGGDDGIGKGKNVDRFFHGVCISFVTFGLVLFFNDLSVLGEVVQLSFFWAAGMALAYTGPWSDALHGRDDGAGALLIRGLKGAAILAIYCIPNKVYAPMVAMVAGFVISPYLSRWIFESRYAENVRSWRIYKRWNLVRKERWNLAEVIRGGLTVLTAWLFVTIFG